MAWPRLAARSPVGKSDHAVKGGVKVDHQGGVKGDHPRRPTLPMAVVTPGQMSLLGNLGAAGLYSCTTAAFAPARSADCASPISGPPPAGSLSTD